MVLLAAAGVGITALLTDLIAVRLQSAALAGLPLLLLFTEPFTLSVSRGFLGTTIAFCLSVAGYLALLSSEGRDRIRDWEHASPDPRDEPDTRTLAAAGRRVGFASVVVALALPLFIPGLHATRLFGSGQPGIGGSGGSGTGTAAGVGFPDPNVVMSRELLSSQPSPVLNYTTTDPAPGYLQLYTLDKLTASGWQLWSQPESLVPVSPELPQAPGLTDASGVARETTTITLAGDLDADQLSALPAPYPATGITAQGNLRADKSTLMLFDNGVSLGGLKYTVTSLDENPPTQLLNSAPSAPASITANYLSVPASYNSLRALAASVVNKAGAKTPYEDALALQNWLDGGSFTYTLHAPTVLTADELTNFLEVTKKGYCQQFSFAMAALARLLGIPSRVAYGFTSGTPAGPNAWAVTTHDAHAWPELYFQGYGWLRFEPTPAGSNGQGTATLPLYSVTPYNPSTPGQSQTTPATGANAGATKQTGIPPNLKNLYAPQGDDGGAAGGSGSGSAGGISPWAIFGLVVAGLIAAALPAPWLARRVIRRRRWQRRAAPGTGGTSRGGRADRVNRADRVQARDVAWAHAAWQELRDDLTDYGAGYQPSESPRAVAARAGAGLGLGEPARAALGRIAMAEERARYAPAPTDGSGLRADSATVRRAIAAAVPREARWRAWLLPPSVVGPTLTAVASAADLYRSSRGPRRARRSPG
jgi:transglutaminase-like putative cysteine protease